MLELKNIHKVFNPGTINEKRAIQNLSFTLNDGEEVEISDEDESEKSEEGSVSETTEQETTEE